MRIVNAAEFRHAASRFVTGVAVLTVLDGRNGICGMTANSFVTVSLSPPTVLVSVRPGRMHKAIAAGGRYGVSVLPKDAQDLSCHFAGRPMSAANPRYELVQGLPKLSGCVAFFACEVTQAVDVSDHTLFIAEVSGCDYRDTDPLVFFSSRYHRGPGVPLDA
jgi:flavin reductase